MTWPLGTEPRVIADRYELTAPIGSGGMGTVWQGFDTVLDRQVAVKLIHAELLPDNRYRRRFRREARILARLDHPGVPDVYDLGDGPGDAYLVMRHVIGENVADLVAECAPLPQEWGPSLTVQLMSILAALHEPGLLHRDVKPGNLILTPAGRLVLCDFGIATSTNSGDYSQITRAGEPLGTTGYTAPEVVAGGDATVGGDLWAAGVVLRELFDTTSGPLTELVDTLTDPDPGRRPRSARAAAAHLTPHLHLDLPGLPGFTDSGFADDLVRRYTTALPRLVGSTSRGREIVATFEPLDVNQIVDLRRHVEHLLSEDRPAQAIPLLREALAAVEPADLVALSLRFDLARCHEAVGDLRSAVDEYEATAADAGRKLGEDHPLAKACDQAATRLTAGGNATR